MFCENYLQSRFIDCSVPVVGLVVLQENLNLYEVPSSKKKTMKTIIGCLILSLHLLLLANFAKASESECTVSLDVRPVFGVLVHSGLKFLNPEFPAWPSGESKISLKAEPATVTLQFEGTSVKLAQFDNTSADFRSEDLKSPGKYYPVQLPITDTTQVGQIYFVTHWLSLEDTRKLCSSIATTFKLDQKKINAWFDYRLWEITSPTSSIVLKQRFPGFLMELHVTPSINKELSFQSSLLIAWPTTPEAEQTTPANSPITDPRMPRR